MHENCADRQGSASDEQYPLRRSAFEKSDLAPNQGIEPLIEGIVTERLLTSDEMISELGFKPGLPETICIVHTGDHCRRQAVKDRACAFMVLVEPRDKILQFHNVLVQV